MKNIVITILALISISASAKTINCTVEGGKNITYLPATVVLDTEIRAADESGLLYIYYRGFTSNGQRYSGGRAYLKDLSPQIASQVKVFDDSRVQIKDSDELRSDVYDFDLVKKRLNIKIKTAKTFFGPKIFTMAKAIYNCD
jgi:hypothetical protein